ncbi:MAG: nucleotide-binding protein [Anaerolineae bacterium]|nr:nucleotide-binding protein [Anaerolineae bacterium]
MKRSRIFIGSSSESIPIAQAIQENLENFAEVSVWNQGIFELSQYTLPTLLTALKDTDYCIFVFGPDDMAVLRQEAHAVVRDNVLYELGLSMGLHGQQRSFIVMPRGNDHFHIPSDLIGLSVATFDPNSPSGNLTTALGTACNQIKRAIEKNETTTRSTAPTQLLGYYDGATYHYKIANLMLEKNCTSICLLQVSSSLIAGPEEGNTYEAPFLDALYMRLRDGAELFHITTLKGMHEHLTSANRAYSSIGTALEKLSRDTSNVSVAGGRNRWSIRVADEVGGNLDNTMIRLAPAFLVRYTDKPTEGLFVVNIGISRTCFHMAGEKIDDFFRRCEDFYHNCRILSWLEVDNMLEKINGGHI